MRDGGIPWGESSGKKFLGFPRTVQKLEKKASFGSSREVSLSYRLGVWDYTRVGSNEETFFFLSCQKKKNKKQRKESLGCACGSSGRGEKGRCETGRHPTQWPNRSLTFVA